jgi:hypothetical protein
MSDSEEEFNKYENGKIYKIIPTRYYEDDDIPEEDQYIGSTIKTLKKRYSHHKYCYKKFINGDKSRSVSSKILFEKYGSDNLKIELIENYPCESDLELRERENYYLKRNYCINKNSAICDIEKVKENERKRELMFYHCECGSVVKRYKKLRHFRSNKHKNYIA